MKKFAVYSFHTRPIELDEHGFNDLGIKLSAEPLHVADTLKDAEKWQQEHRPEWLDTQR